MPLVKIPQALELAKVFIYGRGGDVGPQLPRIRRIGSKLGINPCHVLRTPSALNKPGWHLIARDFKKGMTHAEGAVLSHRGEGVMVPSRDCHVVVAENRKTGTVVAFHVGRNSVFNRQNCSGGTTEKALGACDVAYANEEIYAHVLCGICPDHFEHDDLSYVAPFIEEFGPDVVVDHERGTLDMTAVIIAICARYGIPKDHISTDGLCTYDDDRLGSHRADKKEQNWIFVRKL